MQVTREDLNSCTVQLTVALEPAEVSAAFEKSLKQLAKGVRLPGFRPGHAPTSMVEKVIDERRWYEEAADHLIRQTLMKAVEQQELKPDPNTRPSVELKSLDKGEGKGEYVAKVPLPPVVEIGDYNGLMVEAPEKEVQPEEIAYQVEELRKRRSTREAITDRGIAEGDIAVLNIKPDGDSGEGRNFMTIAGQTFAQLDEAILGMKVEDMKHLSLKFPPNFQESDWSGKTIKCTVTLNSASAVKMPEFDEEFAQSLNVESVDELTARITENLGRAKENMVREVMIEQAMDQLLQRSKVEVSDNSWEAIADRRLSETAAEQEIDGKTMEEYAKENGMTLPELVQAWKDKANLYIKRAFLIREVFTVEKMTLSNEDLNIELYAMAEEYRVEPKEMAATLSKNNALEELRFRAISRKVSDFLLEHAEVSKPGGKKTKK